MSLVSYGGNTNNNIILGSGSFNPSVVYDPDGASDRKYVMTLEQRVGDTAPGLAYLYKSADGISWTYIKALPRTGNVYSEVKEIVKRPDGRWMVYYNSGHVADKRYLGLVRRQGKTLD